MKKKYLIIGNWKMNGLRAASAELAELLAGDFCSQCDVFVCPPALLIAEFAERVGAGSVQIGAQNCHADPAGAHTGEISAEMLADAGAKLVICGHSERRAAHRESDELVRAKAEAGLRAGLMPIICVGESAAERDRGATLEVLTRQVRGSVPKSASPIPLAIAYEPIWAIGSGKAAATQDIEQAHGHIRVLLAEIYGQDHQAVVLYGGSVNPENAAEIIAIDGVGGLLIGGASLKAKPFLSIISTCKRFCS